MRRTVLVPFAMPELPTFVRADVEILERRYRVVVMPCRSARDMLSAVRAVPGASVIYCWFGSLRYLPVVLAARLAGRPVVIIAGGYDVASMAELSYGNMRGGPVRWMGRLLFRLATVVAPYSKAAALETSSNAGVPAQKQRLIYLGFEAAAYGEPIALPQKEAMVLTVGAMNASSIERKGMITMLQASRRLPDVRFVIAGRADETALARLHAAAGANTEFTGFVDDDQLRALFKRAKVYCQLSVHEAFGCTVAEAMLFNCIPILSDRGSLPEVGGRAAIYVQPGDSDALAVAIQQALALTGFPGPEPRASIARNFPRDARARALHQMVEELT
jgi:glycosyltransferase involved in cell wall biosynthesis